MSTSPDSAPDAPYRRVRLSISTVTMVIAAPVALAACVCFFYCLLLLVLVCINGALGGASGALNALNDALLLLS